MSPAAGGALVDGEAGATDRSAFGPSDEPDVGPTGFSLTLANFSGPFDLLLSLIARRRMDITEVALAEVTDEFIAYVSTLEQSEAALDESSAFLVVAASLLDLKTARLLPAGTTESDEDIEMLESRDLLFARLLQYKAFKDIAAMLAERMGAESTRFPRQTGLDERFASVLPELVWTLTPAQFGALAEDVLTRTKDEPEGVGLSHLHVPAVSVREQAGLIAARLQAAGALGFSELVADAGTTLVVVARFLALLEMYRDRAVSFDQDAPLGELTVRWDPHAPDELPAAQQDSEFDGGGLLDGAAPVDEHDAGGALERRDDDTGAAPEQHDAGVTSEPRDGEEVPT